MVLAVLLAGTFMILLDSTIVNVAIPSIQEHLESSDRSIEWVVAGYALAFGLTLIPSGRLGDRFGHRGLFLVGLVGFTIASLLCGVAGGAVQLVVMRALQGAMAGIMTPQILATIQVIFPGRSRSRAFALGGATAALATALGPPLGGILVTANVLGLSWRPTFLINVPIGIVAFAVGVKLLPDSRGRRAELDPVGIVLAAGTVVLVTYPLVAGRAANWPPWAIACLVTGLPALAAFAAWERLRGHRGASPLVDARLFADRSFAAGLAVGFSFAGFTSLFFTLSLYLQIGLRYSALVTGLTILPFAAGNLLGSARSDLVAERFGTRVIHLGLTMVIVGMVGALITIYAVDVRLSGPELIPSLLLAGIGSGLVSTPNTGIVLSRVTAHDAGSASALLSTAKRIGLAIGVAAVSIVFFGAVAANASQAATGPARLLGQELTAAGLPHQATAAGTQRFVSCFEKQARSTDPTVAPPGCAAPRGSGPAERAFASASHQALAHAFTAAIKSSILFDIAACMLALFLACFLPRRTAPDGIQPAGPS